MRFLSVALFTVALAPASLLDPRPAHAQNFRGDLEDYLRTRRDLSLSDEKFLRLAFEVRFARNPEIDSRDCRFKSKKIKSPSTLDFNAKKWASRERSRGRFIFGAKRIDHSVARTTPGVDLVESDINSFDELLSDLQIRHFKGAPFERSIIHFNLRVLKENYGIDRAELLDGLKRAGIPRELADFPNSAPERFRNFLFFHDPIPATSTVSTTYELEYEELFVKCAGRTPPPPPPPPAPRVFEMPRSEQIEVVDVPRAPEPSPTIEAASTLSPGPVTPAADPVPAPFLNAVPAIVTAPRTPRPAPAPVTRATVKRMPRNPNQKRNFWECLPFIGGSIHRANATACPKTINR